LHAAKAAGSLSLDRLSLAKGRSRVRAQWDEALENAVDVVENSLYQKAVNGDTICMIFYLKAHRPIYRDRLNIDIEQVRGKSKRGSRN
jgi:hypothetical protein